MLNSDYDAVEKGILILILVVAGNFISEVLGCNLQNILTNNLLAKHILTFLILFVTVDFSNKDDEVSLLNKLILCIQVYVGFLMFNKMTGLITYIVLFLLLLFFLINTRISNLITKKNNINKEEDVPNLVLGRDILVKVIICLVFFGFLSYSILREKNMVISLVGLHLY